MAPGRESQPPTNNAAVATSIAPEKSRPLRRHITTQCCKQRRILGIGCAEQRQHSHLWRTLQNQSRYERHPRFA